MKHFTKNTIEKINKDLSKVGYSFVINKTPDQVYINANDVKHTVFSEVFFLNEKDENYSIFVFSKECCIRHN